MTVERIDNSACVRKIVIQHARGGVLIESQDHSVIEDGGYPLDISYVLTDPLRVLVSIATALGISAEIKVAGEMMISTPNTADEARW